MNSRAHLEDLSLVSVAQVRVFNAHLERSKHAARIRSKSTYNLLVLEDLPVIVREKHAPIGSTCIFNIVEFVTSFSKNCG